MNKVSRIAIPPAMQGLLPAFFCIFSGVIDRLYLDIDSFLVSMTCNGLYGSGAVCPVIHRCWLSCWGGWHRWPPRSTGSP